MGNLFKNPIACSLALSIITVTGCNSVRAEFPQFQWLTKVGGNLSESANAITVDDATNCFVAGYFGNSTTIGGTTLTNSNGSSNVFLAQFNMAGTPGWAIAPETDGAITDVKLSAGIIFHFLAGTFFGTNLTLGGQTIVNSGTPGDHSSDVFLARLDPNGNVSWLNKAGGTGEDALKAARTDLSGNTYVTGSFESPTFTAGATTLNLQGSTRDCFAVKYGLGGGVVWARQGSNAVGTAIAVDEQRNCYVGGMILGTSAFDGLTPANQTTTNFLIKYDSSGTVLWVRGDLPVGSQLAVDKAQNIYTAGVFSNLLTVGTTTLSNDSPATIYLAKYDSAGEPLWARQLSGFGHDQVTGMFLDYKTNFWVCGAFASDLNGNPVNPHFAVACFDPEGNLLGVSYAEGAPASMAAGMASFQGWLDFICGSFATNIVVGGASLTNNGDSDILIGRLYPVPPALSTGVSNNSFIVSWPAFDLGYSGIAIETATHLTNWVPTNASANVNGQNILTNDLRAGSQFFRLRLQPK